MPTRPVHPGRSSGLNAESLRWAMGCFCAFIGAFILVAPHRFAGSPYAGLAPFRTWWGAAALAGGLGLLTVAILRPRRAAGFAMHALAGLTLLTLAVSFGTRAGWMGLIFYSFLGFALIAAGLLPLRGTVPRPAFEPDLLAWTMGGASLLTGAAMTVFPALFRSSALAGQPLRPLLELGLLVTGGLLCGVHLRRAPRWLVWTAHLASGTVLALWGGLVALPLQAWTGVGLYLGCGTALAFLPWLSRSLSRVDPSALRTRLALALAIATSLALILTAAVATTQEEQLAVGQVLEMRQAEAKAIARNVADYVSLNAAHASTLAAMAGRLTMEPVSQRLFLQQALPLYPGVTGLLSLDPAGRVVAAAGGVPLDAADWRAVAAGAWPDRPVSVQLVSWGREEHPHLVLSAPVVGLDGALAGALVNVIDAASLAQRISRSGSNVYLADGHGRSIARHEEADPSLAGPPLPDGWDRDLAAGRRTGVGHLAAFEPVKELGWWVAVERPRRAALAGVREGRDRAFLLLLIVVPLAVIGGIVTARRISRPLDALAGAVGELTAGNSAAPLRSSSIGEVARLSAAFAEMRDRLAARTRESERLAAELLARAEALADSDRRKDEFLAMLAHELRNPLGAIANSAWVLAEADASQPLTDRAVAVIQRQIQHLVRLVDDLLDVSRITRGKVELRRERIDLADVVRHTVETVRPLMESRDHTLTVDLPAEGLPLDADPTRLEQVVGNLLRNSAKFTDPGGRIGIEVHREDGVAVLSVRDNGAGIAPDLLPRVFDLFTQGQQSIDRAGAGLGIGLTLVRNLVEMHGGCIEARSQGAGTGCTMLVRLPLAEPLSTSAPAPA